MLQKEGVPVVDDSLARHVACWSELVDYLTLDGTRLPGP